MNRQKPDVPHEWYRHFDITPSLVSPMASFGEGYRYNVSGLTHDPDGFPTAVPTEIKAKLDKLHGKIDNYIEEISSFRTEMMDDAHVAVFSYGTVARASYQAVKMARERRIKVGAIQPFTIWPLDEVKIKSMLGHCKKVIVAELNMGQLYNEIRRIVPKGTEVFHLGRYDGEVMTPLQILQKIREVL